MLPRLPWHGVADPMAINRAQRKTNKEIERVVELRKGLSIDHHKIGFDCSNFYGADGVHLSFKGNEIFIQDLWQGLLKALSVSLGSKAYVEA